MHLTRFKKINWKVFLNRPRCVKVESGQFLSGQGSKFGKGL
jgi:hypothetical protein